MNDNTQNLPRATHFKENWKRVHPVLSEIIEFFAKLLPIAALAATTIAYFMMLSYTSTHSVPFPYAFAPYMIMFSVIIILTIIFISVFSFPPFYWTILAFGDEYEKFLEVGAKGGLLRLSQFPQSCRITNFFAPAIVFEVFMILYFSWENLTFLSPPIAGGTFFIIWIISSVRLLTYIKGLSLKDREYTSLYSMVFYLFMCNCTNIIWYVSMLLVILKIPLIESYDGENARKILVLIMIVLLAVQVVLFWLSLKASQNGIFLVPLVISLYLLFFYPGGAFFMKNTLMAHNLGGGVIANLTMRGNACYHLNDLVERTIQTEPETVCITKSVPVLLNVGDTIYVGKDEPDGEQPTGGENNDQNSDKGEKVWSVDRSAVIGMEFQSRGRPKWIALPDRES